MPFLLTSESVSEGHPDKAADQISDAILDAILKQDKNARVAAETVVMRGLVLLSGEITTFADVDYCGVVRNTLKRIGYTAGDCGFSSDTYPILVNYNKQSVDIAHGIQCKNDSGEGAGDQGIVFGYACDETSVLMPASIYYAHCLMKKHASVRKNGMLQWLRPDAKTQLTVRYDEESGKPIAFDTVIFSTQHDESVRDSAIKHGVIEEIIRPVLPAHMIDGNTKFLINPAGRFVIGGPIADTGLTGRKIVVDTYGCASPHGGGAFSGKDPSKIDRSGAYFARYIAKNIVASKLVKKCQVQIAYAIGVAAPVSININTFGVDGISDRALEKIVQQHFDLRPRAIIKELNLLQPIYEKTAVYGHFGREDESFKWEDTDKVHLFK
ncbi:S-adenosylmethionine synthase [Candidatus Fokinia solitaria]|uniref:S-adenosylmethionine synthase n=1 Tax=Candidatus Fokinia solitaria TaxID=1802984 RepID=A0A2U8BRD8_9RICK|nr:methionine adenosyltransferase [Candidatus Fokinia solitaria]AWD32916.1 S-adenosylmethionine synthase [Candidatus Fokinia solitaria]